MDYRSCLLVFLYFMLSRFGQGSHKAILDSRVKPGAFDKTNELHKAVRGMNYVKVRELLAKDSFFLMNERDESGRTALGIALQRGDKGMARIIIHRDNRLHPKPKSSFKSTPLHHAIFWRNIDAINYYLLYGDESYFDEENDFDETPLAYAIKCGMEVLAGILFNRIKELQIKDYHKLGRSKLHLAAMIGRYDAALYYFEYKDRSHFSQKDIYGKTPLNYALDLGDERIIKLAMKAVPPVMQVKFCQHPPLRNEVEFAALANRSDIAEYFLRFNCGFEKEYLRKNKKGENPLHIAAALGHCDVVDAIIKYYIQEENDEELIDKQTTNGGYTALHLAARNNHLACVKSLLKAGADTYITNDEELTPWREFKRKGKKNLTKVQSEIRELLKHSRKYDVG